MWERYFNASPKPEFFIFSLFVFSFISQLIWVRLHWNFHRWFSIQKQVNWCTIDPFSLKFCTCQHSYPVPLSSCCKFMWSVLWKDLFSLRWTKFQLLVQIHSIMNSVCSQINAVIKNHFIDHVIDKISVVISMSNVCYMFIKSFNNLYIICLTGI